MDRDWKNEEPGWLSQGWSVGGDVWVMWYESASGSERHHSGQADEKLIILVAVTVMSCTFGASPVA